MKRLILFTFTIVFLQLQARGQQGDIEVLNYTTCDFYFDAVAVCPNCVHYSTEVMTFYPGATFYNFPVSTYPWFNGVSPECSDWRWQYAYITICGYTFIVGQDDFNCGIPFTSNYTTCSGCPILHDWESKSLDCCQGENGGPVQVSWSVKATGGILIVIY